MSRLILLFCVVLWSCNDKDPAPESPESKWSYTTPDLKMTVTFEVVRMNDNAYDVKSLTMTIDNVLFNSEKEVVGFTKTSIEKLRINANDAKAVYPYNIEFKNATISADFKTISVPFATYTYPWGTTNNLTNITIEAI
jgi:hypothetical protein